jgi:peptidoglycan/LPS O-acetylase OafA/YrhL
MATAEIFYRNNRENVELTTPRFYRPELDALRFFAFLSVYICHSIPSSWVTDTSNFSSGKGSRILAAVKDSGNFGVCLFFLLSAFLITELLRREYESYGIVHVKAFYLRRILRIWPLYLGVTSLYAIGGHFFPALRMEPARVTTYLLLAGNWYIAFHPWIQTPLRSLWSISVEEQFYLTWPLLAKLGNRRTLAISSLAIVPISFLTIYLTSTNQHYAYITVWVNSLAQFQFFAWGALLALILNGYVPKLKINLRSAMVLMGISAWLFTSYFMKIKRPNAQIQPYQYCLGYMLVAVGCILLFLAVFGMPARSIPRWAVYCGKVSFGLYVFHETAFLITDEVQKHTISFLPLISTWTSEHLLVTLTVNKIAALAATMALAAFSYHFWESPFLRLKQRVTFTQSRGI